MDDAEAKVGLPASLMGAVTVVACVLAGRIELVGSRAIRREIGLSTTEWRVIATAGAEPGASPQRVIDVAAVDKSGISRAIQALARKGLLEIRADARRSRWTLLYLTEKGERVHEIGVALTSHGDSLVFEGFAAEEREAALALFARMLGNLADYREKE